MDEQTLIFYEPVTWGYFSTMQHDKIWDPFLTDAFNIVSIFDFKKAITKLCGPMESNLTINTSKDIHFDTKDTHFSVLGTGFTQVPGGSDYNNRSVLSWHYYCNLFDSQLGNDTLQSILVQERFFIIFEK